MRQQGLCLKLNFVQCLKLRSCSKMTICTKGSQESIGELAMALTLRSNLLGRQGHQFSAKPSGFTGTLGSEKFLLLTSIYWGWDLPGFPWKHHETSTSEKFRRSFWDASLPKARCFSVQRVLKMAMGVTGGESDEFDSELISTAGESPLYKSTLFRTRRNKISFVPLGPPFSTCGLKAWGHCGDRGKIAVMLLQPMQHCPTDSRPLINF